MLSGAYKCLQFQAFVKATSSIGFIAAAGMVGARAVAGAVVGLEFALAYCFLFRQHERIARFTGVAFMVAITVMAIPIVARGESCQCMWRWVPLYVDTVGGLLARNALLVFSVIVITSSFGSPSSPRLRRATIHARMCLVGLLLVALTQSLRGPELPEPLFTSVPPPLSVSYPDVRNESGSAPSAASAGVVRTESAATDAIGILGAGGRDALAGCVVSPEGAPIPGAVVHCSGNEATPQPLSCVTDGLGQFFFVVPDTGVYSLRASAKGRVDGYVTRAVPHDSYVIVLGLPATITGTVADATGVVVPGVRLVCTDARDNMREVAKGLTDASGHYCFAGLPAGCYQIAGFSSAYRSASLILTVGWGEQRVANITMETGTTLRGRVVDSTSGRPIAACTVSVGASFSGKTAQSNEHGEFLLCGLPARGVSILCARADGYAEWTASVRLVEAPPDLEVRLEQGATIEGRVMSEGVGVANARVVLKWTRTVSGAVLSRKIEVRSSPGGDFSFSGLSPSVVWSLWSASNGMVACAKAAEELGAGSHRVDLVMHPGARVLGQVVGKDDRGVPASVSIGSEEWGVEQSLDCSASGKFLSDAIPIGTYQVRARYKHAEAAQSVIVAKEEDVVVSMRLDGSGTISGRLLRSDGSSAGSCVVIATRDGVRTVSNGLEGGFVLCDLASGEYTLEAWDTSSDRGVEFGARMDSVLSGASNVTLRLPEVQTLRGRVLRGGVSITGARICGVTTADRMQATAVVTADEHGRFELLLPVGLNYHVRIEIGERSFVYGPLTLPLAATVFELPP